VLYRITCSNTLLYLLFDKNKGIKLKWRKIGIDKNLSQNSKEHYNGTITFPSYMTRGLFGSTQLIR
jgi:hypothetical protein